ncbi:DNA translocase FtsK [Chryseobacterium arthrosphaerae]|uniref:DNA translocase FtsK n=1 Tax=Chryseobacterium arthrosphaerae TaxID=651561 RepID=UPI00241D0105|nr:DNA translocase FtsK [Chryseobacterium arthrosphaerae]
MSIYKTYTPEQIDALNSDFIVSSWSYSKLAQFARNEKAFEMIYIYGYQSKSSATTVAGNAYHEALSQYFKAKKDGYILSLPELEQIAFEYVENVEANKWKLQKTTPTIDESKIKASKTVTALLGNFYREKGIYEDYISEIIAVEVSLKEYLTINGVDVPIPCNFVIDLVFKDHDGKIIIIDHKTKNTYTPDDELSLSIGKQGMTYVKGYESFSGIQVDEVWFSENKYSKNKNDEPQIRVYRVVLDEDTRKLYEVLLYEPLKRMIEAVNDPDYVYVINDNDNFVDRAELYEFWAKTLISEIDEFDIDETKRGLIEKRTRKIRDSSINNINPKVIKQFKANAAQFIQYDLSTTDMTQENKIEHVLKTFGMQTQVAHTLFGYSSNTYLLEIGAGVKIGSIQKFKLDIANQLNVNNVRIPSNLKILDGKSYLAVETSKKREKDLFWNAEELSGLKIPLGKDNLGNTLFWDLLNHSTPHQLVGGSTGSGKSVYIDSILNYTILAGLKDVYIFDPKYEFEAMRDLGIEVYNDIEEIEVMFQLLVERMNEKIKQKDDSIVMLFIDELADLIDAAGKNSMISINLKRLLQKGRSSGFRVLAATQRASVKVISGDTKVNFPINVCFRVPKAIDSKVMIDDEGAETLAGMGDGLIKSPEYPDLVRFQSFYKPQEQTA